MEGKDKSTLTLLFLRRELKRKTGFLAGLEMTPFDCTLCARPLNTKEVDSRFHGNDKREILKQVQNDG